jgi:hypothetical protein
MGGKRLLLNRKYNKIEPKVRESAISSSWAGRDNITQLRTDAKRDISTYLDPCMYNLAI